MASETVQRVSLSHQVRSDLDKAFRRVWGLGANLIIGWRLLPHSLEIVYLSSFDLPKVAKLQSELLKPNRQITSEKEYHALVKAGCKLTKVSLTSDIGREENTVNYINNSIRNFTVTHYPCRAVALFDMVSFSIHSPFQQITQISVLSHYIRLAERRCQMLGMPIKLCMTTTGDGFYVWNNYEGIAADIALYNATILALTYNYVSRDLATTQSVPRLRCVIHFGSHYEYYQGSTEEGQSSAFIVGDVTVNAARLISGAMTNQLLVGSYSRDIDAGNEELSELVGLTSLETPSFLALAQNETRKLIELPIPGGKIEDIKAFLTGPKVSANAFTIRKYYITDKHGLEHGCYNAKLTVTSSSGDKVSFGLLDKDLEKFKARVDEDEDIVIRIR